jgi:hypothetical protein
MMVARDWGRNGGRRDRENLINGYAVAVYRSKRFCGATAQQDYYR